MIKSGDKLAKVTGEVSKECLKQLKIYAVQKDLKLYEAVSEILERAMTKKQKVVVEMEE